MAHGGSNRSMADILRDPKNQRTVMLPVPRGVMSEGRPTVQEFAPGPNPDITTADVAETLFGLVGGPFVAGMTYSPEAQGASLKGGRAASGVGSKIAAKIRGEKPQPYAVTKDTPPEIAAALRGVPYPNIYKDPRQLVAGAKVAEEDPIMQQLFGVGRRDLYDISQQGTRRGNVSASPFKQAAKPKGAEAATAVMTPENERRLLNIIEASRERPELFEGMASWYTMDPLYQRFVEIHGPEKAKEMYRQFNAMTGMASPNSEVLTELQRGTAANMLAHAGRFDEFQKYGGLAAGARGADFPEDIRTVQGHVAHSTAHAKPMAKFLREGRVEMDSPKVPTYIEASGVPETGFQTEWPVGDAHWSRLVGLPETRTMDPARRGASASRAEMSALSPWWREKIAEQSGLEAVPAQAVVWGAGSNATGVTSPIGAPKLELLSQQIRKAADRMGVSPETARDLIIAGKAHAGFIDPRLAAGIGGGAAAMAAALRGEQQGESP